MAQFVFTRLAQRPEIVATGPLGKLFETKPMPGVKPPEKPVAFVRPFPEPSFYQDVKDIDGLGQITALNPLDWAMPETATKVAQYFGGTVATANQNIIDASGYVRLVDGAPRTAIQYLVLITRDGKTARINAGRLAEQFIAADDAGKWGGAKADADELIAAQFRQTT